MWRNLTRSNHIYCGPGSSVGIATGQGLDGPGIEPRWVEIFRICLDRRWGTPSLLYNGYRVFPGGKKRQGREADPSLPSSAVVPFWAVRPVQSLSACTRVQFTLPSLHHMYSNNCTIIRYNNIQTCGKPPTYKGFFGHLQDVFDNPKYSSGQI